VSFGFELVVEIRSILFDITLAGRRGFISCATFKGRTIKI
jgi:hypothetical protein